MKAFRIISTEYKANIPSVFLFIEGDYFGDLGYPSRDKFPKDIEHWRTATCADADRFFNVEEVEVPVFLIDWLREIRNKRITCGKWLSDDNIDKSVRDSVRNSINSKIYAYYDSEITMIKKLEKTNNSYEQQN